MSQLLKLLPELRELTFQIFDLLFQFPNPIEFGFRFGRAFSLRQSHLAR